MALQKQPVSIDFIKGADTKTNDQISTNAKEMENVVFTGNLTAKKMNGYDVISQLPSTDKFSLISRRKNDLLAFSDNGVYKFNSNVSTFSKISKIGTTFVESNECKGKMLAFSTDYYCTYEMISNDNGLTYLSKASFYTKDGSLLNTWVGLLSSDQQTSQNYVTYQTSKIMNIGNDFYFGCIDYTLAAIFFQKFSLNTSTNKFEYVSMNASVNIGGFGTITGIDYICDNQYIYCVYTDGAANTKAVKFDTLTPMTLPTVTTLAIVPKTNIELFLKDASNLYLSFGTDAGAVLQHKLSIILKSSMAITSTSNLYTYQKISNGIADNWPFVYCYPTSDTTAVARSFVNPNTNIVGTGNNSIILSPLGKIFKQGSNYYMPCYFYNFAQVANAVMLLNDKFGNGSYYELIPHAITDSGIVEYQKPPFLNYSYAFNCLNQISSDGEFNYFTGLTAEGQTTLIKFSKDAKQQSSYIEIDSTNIIASSLPLYFDGESCAEYGFLGVPQITDYSTNTTGSLPADSGYMLMAQFEWKDALGNVFHSQYSQIFSNYNPTSGITLPANSKIQIVVQCGLLTQKQNVKLKIFIKRKTVNSFQLAAEKYIDTSDYRFSYAFTISNYPSATAEEAVYQDDSIQPMMVTNYESLSLYSDRIINTTKDFPMAINYSQKKEFGQSFEFNDSTFTLDVLDKRGISEDGITGTIAMDGRLLIFKEKSILYINGSGPARTNLNSDFSEPQLVTTDAGCTEPRSIVLTPSGVMFKSDKGIYLLDRYLKVQYIGTGVEAFNSNTITSAILLEGVNEIRFTTLEGIVLVYNYFSSAWSWFTNLPAISACIWKDKYVLLLTNGKVLTESNSHKKIVDGASSTAIVQKISTPWFRLNGEQWWQKVYDVLILGRYKTEHQIKLSVYYDYELYPSDVYTLDPLTSDQYNITTRPTNQQLEENTMADGVYQLTIDMVRKSCQAFRVVIEDIPLNIASNTGESFEVSNITATLGLKKGPARLPANKSY